MARRFQNWVKPETRAQDQGMRFSAYRIRVALCIGQPELT